MKCGDCGMAYNPEKPEDSREHADYHDTILNGLPSLPMEDDEIIWSKDDLLISFVNDCSLSDKRKYAEKVASYARLDTDYSAEDLFGEPKLETHVFLLHIQNRIVGLLTVDRRVHIWKADWTNWDNDKNPKELLENPPMWSICFVWVLKKHRGSSLGQTFIEKSLVYLGCDFQTVGWYTPFTPSGEALVRNCCPEAFYIAK